MLKDANIWNKETIDKKENIFNTGPEQPPLGLDVELIPNPNNNRKINKINQQIISKYSNLTKLEKKPEK